MRIALLLLGVVFASPAWAEGKVCRNDQSCAPYEICTTSVGVCDSGDGNADVCSGTCEMGQRIRFVPYAGGGVMRMTHNVPVGIAQAGLEVIPDLFGGHLSVSGEYFGGTLRTGIASPWPLFDGFLLSPRVDLLPLTEGGMKVMGGLRLDYFPWMPFKTLTPAHYFSLALEGGALIDGRPSPYGTLSLRIWL